jgi:hypothetical protein
MVVMKYQRKIEAEYYCPLEYGLDIFGGKWKSRIICILRFSQNFSFGKTTLDLGEKAGFRPLFPKLFSKLSRVLEGLPIDKRNKIIKIKQTESSVFLAV